jgi:hypothetical protein
MGLRACHRRRRVAAFLALVSVAFYTALFPWHDVSRTSLLLFALEHGSSPAVTCHDEPATGTPQPAKPKSHCPICNGFAALQFALASTATFAVAPPDMGTIVHHVGYVQLVSVALRAPQNRGPPHFPA